MIGINSIIAAFAQGSSKVPFVHSAAAEPYWALLDYLSYILAAVVVAHGAHYFYKHHISKHLNHEEAGFTLRSGLAAAIYMAGVLLCLTPFGGVVISAFFAIMPR